MTEVDPIKGVEFSQPLQEANACLVIEGAGEGQANPRYGLTGRDFLKNRGKMVQQSGGALVGPCGKMTQWLEQRAACVHWRGLDFCAAHIQAQVDILHRPSFSG